jgi:FMN-dependent NADH-azoreductase
MPKLLVINSSPRGDRSLSRSLTTKFVEHYLEAHPEATVVTRDLGHDPVPPVTEPWIVGAFAPAEAQTEESRAAIGVSDALVDELLAADHYVFGVPMYNLHIPATFKAWIDQVVRVGRTFAVGAGGYEGLVKGRKALFITASGGAYTPGTPFAAYNFQEPYLRAISGFIGITDVQFVAGDGQNLGEAAARKSAAVAEATLRDLALAW